MFTESKKHLLFCIKKVGITCCRRVQWYDPAYTMSELIRSSLFSESPQPIKDPLSSEILSYDSNSAFAK